MSPKRNRPTRKNNSHRHQKSGLTPKATVLHEQKALNIGESRTLSKKVDWVFVVAVIGSIGTLVGVVFAYQEWSRSSEQPDLGFYAFKVQDNEEYYYDEMCIERENIHEDGETTWVTLPLKLINHSGKDAENITIWLTTESDETHLRFPEPEWVIEKYANREWGVVERKPLAPKSGAKFYGVMLQTAKSTRRAKLLWRVYTANSVPKEGIIDLCF